ncbi:MAG: hypothetical protein AUI36_11660 [Cyanobacteria bacterium 13_1_40CM_2_61_4]|nr:MAG: hypothetical protein AUI36_11660 [Cyanobacteria bacterium 13_1_40CM_2_61_4]
MSSGSRTLTAGCGCFERPHAESCRDHERFVAGYLGIARRHIKPWSDAWSVPDMVVMAQPAARFELAG